MLMPGAGLESALAVAERIRTAAAVRPLGGIAWAVTVSIGAAACSRDCVIDALIVRADEALYQAKAAGRNRVVGLGAGREIDARQTAEAVA